MLRRCSVAAIATVIWLSWSSHADACSYAPDALHEVDMTLDDASAPTVPIVTTTQSSRRLGSECNGGSCTESSCGDTASVAIEFAASTDDLTDMTGIGYGLRVLSGTLPGYADGVTALVTGGLEDGSGTLALRMNFDTIVDMDAVVVLQAVDRAGNVTESEPFNLVFSGCTYSLFGETCMGGGTPTPGGDPGSSGPPPGEPGSAPTSGESGNLVGVNGSSSGGGCTLAPAPRRGDLALVGLTFATLLVARRRPARR